MNTPNRKPRWWQLSLLAPLMTGLLLVDVHMNLSPAAHQMVEVGVVLLMYGAMAYWLWMNQAALESTVNETQTQPQTIARLEPIQTVSGCQLVEQAREEQQPSDEPVGSAWELQQVLLRPELHCTPPSGARLN